MKVSELSGVLLDYWVGSADGKKLHRIADFTDGQRYCLLRGAQIGEHHWLEETKYSPSTDWGIAGPIIDRERIEVTPWDDAEGGAMWAATAFEQRVLPVLSSQRSKWGITPLVAAMRCYVASKFGEEVSDEVPA